MQFFVPGRITNPLNGSHAHWTVRAKWAKTWRTATAWIAAAAWIQSGGLRTSPHTPKRIRFTGHVVRRFDDDNFRAAMKPVRDGLQDAGVIAGDGPDCGHVFVYAQVVDQGSLGVRVEVEATC